MANHHPTKNNSKMEKEPKERQRKVWTRGEVTQKMVNFRCDLDNVEWLAKQPNKGRAINEAIAAYRKHH